MKKEKIACYCREVSYGKIEDAVKNGAVTLEKLKEVTGCGNYCGKCNEFLPYLLNDILEELET